MIEVEEKTAFYYNVAAQSPAVWPVANGVSFVSRREHHDWGIALHIEGRALRPEHSEKRCNCVFQKTSDSITTFCFWT